ncbi:MAG: NIPSNAP family protein [Parafilimonas terrae]|nr:NIPSNAP family protein [Parafilimonas terrae]
MIYELRLYACLPGRMPDLLRRFEEAALGLWAKHGIRQVGAWTTVVGESNNTLTYLLAWESMAERETRWAAFQSDPAWVQARADSERNGPILANVANSFLAPTAFSALK